MKLTSKMIADIARATRTIPNVDCPPYTLEIYADGNALHIYEDVSGHETYPGKQGEFVLSARFPMTRGIVAELAENNGHSAPAYLLK